MIEHDAGGSREPRLHPYDLIFGAPDFPEARFELVHEQATAHGALAPSTLAMLPAAGELLRALLPESAGAAHRDTVTQVSALLFHAYRYWLHGRTTYELDHDTVRSLLARSEPIGEWRLVTPRPAGYVQLPRNLVWARVAQDAAAEPADGFFWSSPAAGEGLRGERLDLLLTLGVRRGRPGLSLVDVGIEDSEALAHWADVDARPGAVDFENILPGGELQGYHSLTTHAEIVKLACLCFWRIAQTEPRRLEDAESVRYVVDG